jgi:hypothetical protein
VEQATLRPVPLRPAGPVDAAEALAHVLAVLPDLAEEAARALALIEIAGRTHDKAVEEMQVSTDALADLLYGARKSLRRSIFPLSSSGWCERAERLLSAGIDGMLLPPGPALLDVHLRNCERCVDHERRLSQAREKLVRDFTDAHPDIVDAGPAERPVTALRVVEAVVVEPLYERPNRAVASFSGLVLEPDEGAPLPDVSFSGPGGRVEVRTGATEKKEPAVEPDELPPDPPYDDDIPPSEPADTTPSEHDAEDPTPPVEETEGAISPATLVWGGLTVIPLSLAIVALAVAILVVSGLV